MYILIVQFRLRSIRMCIVYLLVIMLMFVCLLYCMCLHGFNYYRRLKSSKYIYLPITILYAISLSFIIQMITCKTNEHINEHWTINWLQSAFTHIHTFTKWQLRWWNGYEIYGFKAIWELFISFLWIIVIIRAIFNFSSTPTH